MDCLRAQVTRQLTVKDGNRQVRWLNEVRDRTLLSTWPARSVAAEAGARLRACACATRAQLEYIEGELWGNVWQTECVARVNVTTGRVTAWVLLHGLLGGLVRRNPDHAYDMDVLNGAWGAF